jgi:predicted PurR-regulated permease PerM
VTTDDAGTGADRPAPGADPGTEDGRRLRGLLQRFRHEDDERLAERIIQQWAQVRAERRPAPPVIRTGPSNFSRAQVPWGVDLAAAWAWRFLVICAAGYIVLWLLSRFAVVTLPLAIALLVAAMGSSAVHRMQRVGLPRGAAAGVVVVGGLVFVGVLLTFVGQQVATGFTELGDQVVAGLDEVESWLKTGPLNATDSQINHYIQATQAAITEGSGEAGALSQVTSVGSAVGHVLAGFFIVLFATYFFLADGDRIWAWIVRLAPRAARAHLDSSGRVAWISLTQFVRATVIVAAVDALGIMAVALVLDVPFVLAIGVLVFLGSFVPMIGATVAGIVAVLVALVDQGPVVALLMLGGVILVQQVEGHVLQPFLMGRFVSLHPLGVIVAIGCGVIVAGVAGALVAVPLAAAVNAVVQHLASDTELGDQDPRDDLEQDIAEEGVQPPPVPEEGPLHD